MCSSIIRRRDSPESFLACCIPDLKFDGFSSNIDCSDLEINTNGTNITLCVCIISKSKKQTRFANAAVPNQQKFEKRQKLPYILTYKHLCPSFGEPTQQFHQSGAERISVNSLFVNSHAWDKWAVNRECVDIL
mmetsp:Transcript_14447/g.18342  ORF Transcript_14447/g.18342 Transcript_14447/m.18342 type:complete len:133 (+) Transcript_14447:521-919(+)